MSDWIVVPNWSRFQHYKDRNPPWIKSYLELLRKDEYVGLSLAERGLLHGIWLAYAATDGRLRTDRVHSEITHTTRSAHLDALSQAGLLRFSASKPLSLSLNQGPPAHARVNGTAPPAPCPECGVGAGLHTADCPTLLQLKLQLPDLVEGGRR